MNATNLRRWAWVGLLPALSLVLVGCDEFLIGDGYGGGGYHGAYRGAPHYGRPGHYSHGYHHNPPVARSEHGRTALHYAARGGHERRVESLLKHGHYSNTRDYKDRTALHYAAGEGHKDVVRELLKRDANVFARDYKGRKPSDIAAGAGHKDLARYLRDKERQHSRRRRR